MDITFIIPTVARPSLLQSLQSLILQDDPDWKAIVVLDWVMPTEFSELPDDERFTYLMPPKKLGHWAGHGQAGIVRNYGIKRAMTPWVAFLDDDDVVTADYVSCWKRHITEAPDLDFIIFRMTMNGDKYPPDGYDIEACKVGISFCARTKAVQTHGFENNDLEDFLILNRLKRAGCKYIISPEITYRVRGTVF